MEWIRDHLDRPLAIEDLARRSKMSARNFQRVFTRQCGMPPAKFIERLRVERARLIIEDTGLSMAEIARKSGFDSEQRMRRAFRRVLGNQPGRSRRSCPSPDCRRSGFHFSLTTAHYITIWPMAGCNGRSCTNFVVGIF